MRNKTFPWKEKKRERERRKSQGPIRKSIVRGDDWLTPLGGPGVILTLIYLDFPVQMLICNMELFLR